jgi:4-hydroxybenzoate polyprenyltransferase
VIAGIKSSARYFGGFTQQAVGLCYGATIALAGVAAWLAGAGFVAFIGLGLFALHLGWQVRSIAGADGPTALMLFRSNWHAGLLLAGGLALDALVKFAF